MKAGFPALRKSGIPAFQHAPSRADAHLRALAKGLPLIKQSGKPFNFLLARVRPNLRNNDGTAAALEALGLVLPVRMHERVIYAPSTSISQTALHGTPWHAKV
jgi:chromosome partitioning protein